MGKGRNRLWPQSTHLQFKDRYAFRFKGTATSRRAGRTLDPVRSTSRPKSRPNWRGFGEGAIIADARGPFAGAFFSSGVCVPCVRRAKQV